MNTEGCASYVGGSPEQVLSHGTLPGNRQALPTGRRNGPSAYLGLLIRFDSEIPKIDWLAEWRIEDYE
jgi:hypothetical protein